MSFLQLSNEEDKMVAFIVEEEIRKFKLKKERAIGYKKSRLERYDFEIKSLKEGGLNFSEITQWLRQNRRIKVHRTTVARWYKKHYG